MEVWQIVLLSYVGALVIWLIINVVFLLISMVIKRKLFSLLEAVGAVLALLIAIASGIGDLILIIWLFSEGQILFAILALILGISLISSIGNILVQPFYWMTMGFSVWYDSMKERE